MQIISGDLLHCFWQGSELALEYLKDGALAIDQGGTIVAKGDFQALRQQFPEAVWSDYRGKLILPGFLDTHIHFPQMNMIGQIAPSLLPWLEEYTFPAEISFLKSEPLIKESAHHFVDELLANGTTTACVYSSSSLLVTEVLFGVFAQRGLRGIIGKTSMDRHAPESLLVPLEVDLEQQMELLERWHGFDRRLFLALTPRFAPSCTPELMVALARLHAAHPDTYIQTHYAENLDELTWIKQLFPKAKDYLAVYEFFGLAGPRSIYAHGIHVSIDAIKRLAAHKVVLSHCPSSNLFLGSGLFDWQSMSSHGVPITLGTDIGAGTSFSLWQTMNEAHKVAALRSEALPAMDLFAAATLRAAVALDLNDLGSLELGYQADLQILSPSRRPLLERRLEACMSSSELLSALIHLADDRCVEAVWVKGKKVR